MKVDVYYNLHKKCLSVKSREGKSKGRIIHYAHEVWLENCQFVVQPSGRARVLKEKRKNVHAFVRGDFSFLASKVKRSQEICDLDGGVEATYNPYRWETFVERQTGKPILKADFVKISGKKVTAYTS